MAAGAGAPAVREYSPGRALSDDPDRPGLPAFLLVALWALILLGPLPFGSVQPWSVLILELVAGRIIAQQGWQVLEYPAIRDDGSALWPARHSVDDLKAKRAELGSRIFTGQYLARPTALEGYMFKREWFGRYRPGGHGCTP